MNLFSRILLSLLFAFPAYATDTHPGGTNGQIQYNNNGYFGGLANPLPIINGGTGNTTGDVPYTGATGSVFLGTNELVFDVSGAVSFSGDWEIFEDNSSNLNINPQALSNNAVINLNTANGASVQYGLDANGYPLFTTASPNLTLQQTGGGDGSSYLTLASQEGANGAIFGNPSLDLVDFAFDPSSNVISNIRYEHRMGFMHGGNDDNDSGEFQFINNDDGGYAWTGPYQTGFDFGAITTDGNGNLTTATLNTDGIQLNSGFLYFDPSSNLQGNGSGTLTLSGTSTFQFNTANLFGVASISANNIALTQTNNGGPAISLQSQATPSTLADGYIWYASPHFFGRAGGTTYQLDQTFTKLATVTGINAKTIANTLLYTAPAGKSCVETSAVVRATAQSGTISAGPIGGVGNIAGTNNIFTSQSTGVTANNASYGYIFSGTSVVTPGGTNIYYNLGTGATGTGTETIAIDLIGYCQ